MTAESAPARPGGGVLPKFIRDVRALLVVQLLVAAIAVAATVWALMTLPAVRSEQAELEQINKNLNTDNAKKAAAAVEMDRRLEGLANAFPYMSQGIEAGARADWPEAVSNLTRANGLGENNPGILRALSWAEFNAGKYDDAVRHIGEARTHSAGQLVLQDFTRRATYECAAGRPERAVDVLRNAEFAAAARASPDLIEADRTLLQRCRRVSSSILALARTPGAAASAEAFRIKFIFLHVSRPEDRAAAEAIAQRLQNAPAGAGYVVPGVEIVERRNTPGVRYYYGAQSEEAGRIAALLRDVAAELRIDAWDDAPLRTMSLEGRYQGLPTNSVEVWLPSGAPAQFPRLPAPRPR